MGEKLAGLPESKGGGQWFRVRLEEFVRLHDLTTGQIASSVRSPEVLSQREQSTSSRARPSCTGTWGGWRSGPVGTL